MASLVESIAAARGVGEDQVMLVVPKAEKHPANLVWASKATLQQVGLKTGTSLTQIHSFIHSFIH